MPSKWKLLNKYLHSKCLLLDKWILGYSTKAFGVEKYEIIGLEEKNFKDPDILNDL